MPPRETISPFPHPGDAFLTPSDWLVRISKYMLEFKEKHPGHPASEFRGRLLKEVHEAWQAATFGFAYGCAHKLGTLQVRHNRKQYAENDASFRWTENGKEFLVPVQVKELPPREVNPKETIDKILEKISTKYPKSHDLLVAIHLNRTEVHARNIRFKTPVTQLWLWGWSKPDHSELFFTGGGHRLSRTFRVPFQVFTDMADTQVLEVPFKESGNTTTI